MTSLEDCVLLIVAGFGAGVVNTIAGGGTFLTFPALVFVGIPPVAANATSAVVVFPGYLGGALGFIKELKRIDSSYLLRIGGVAAVGGLSGSLLLVASSEAAFSFVIPILLLFATLSFAFPIELQRWMARMAKSGQAGELGGMFFVSLYGGYFNGGLGIVLLGLFSLWGMKDLNMMNTLKIIMSIVVSVVSIAIFATSDLIAWHQAAVMMVAAIAGGYCGVPIARALPPLLTRLLVVGIGLSMSLIFFIRAVG
jgi:uncharacterized protein